VRALVLWDVDGTLVDVDGVGSEAFDLAFRVVLGRDPAAPLGRMIAMAGRTDPAIALEALALHGVADGERHLPAFTAALAEQLAATAGRLRERGRALPGAAEALAALAAEAGVVQSVLTGNLEPNALLKLAAFGLDGWLDLDVGGYGSDHAHRPALVEVARAKALTRYGHAFTPATTVLVGDTPLDVAAGHQGGARVVAVATGRYAAAELARAGAEAVLEDLRDTGRVVEAILGRPRHDPGTSSG
jgi:phosphoglycolate phosphatase-like HAD superfamily hydrolase